MIKKIFFLFFIFCINTQLFSQVKTLIYEDRVNNERYAHVVKEYLEDNKRVVKVDRHSEKLSFRIENNEMNYLSVKSKKNKNNFEVRRIGNELKIKGVYQGNKIEKVKKIDDARWSNAPGLTFEEFFKSNKKEVSFWIMSTHSLRVIKMRLQKQGISEVTINNQPLNLLKVTMAPDSWLAMFWEANLWVDPRSGFTYLYKGPNQDKNQKGSIEIVFLKKTELKI